MSHERNIKLLNDRRIVYKRDPVDDVPTHQTDKYMFFEQGTYECYTLFASKAKITTYKSLKWHLLTLWYLNPDLDQDEFMQIAEIISIKEQGFTSFTIHIDLLRKMVYEVSMLDLDEPPKNKLRKVVFKYGCGLTKEQKLSIVGELIGRSKRIHEDDIYQCMLDLNDLGKKITITQLALYLECSTRTIHRNMGEQLKREKELLNQQFRDDTIIGVRSTADDSELYAFVEIPYGKTATNVTVYGNDASLAVNVYESDINAGALTDKTPGAGCVVGDVCDITDVAYSATNYLAIKVTTVSYTNDIVYGAVVTIT
ncbi:hypothetical protein N9C94_01810 [Candidatus Pelagibacter sp.]|nr:hypothetical protein [Candidatus Pelagibacter sp.]